ncbi:DNA-directed RNA polymerase IV subunit 1-like protein [Drosera capensis]
MENDAYLERPPSGQLTGISFSIMSEADAEKFAVLSIESVSEVTDPKLGFPNPTSQCTTCGAENSKHCEGHFGVIKFPFTILNPYYISEVAQILNKVCPGCKSLRQDSRAKASSKVSILEQLRGCKYCVRQRRYPSMRFKVSSTDLFRRTAITVESAGTNLPDDYWDFIPKDKLLEESLNRSNKRVLSHAQIRHLLKDIDLKLIREFVPRADALFLSCFPMTPNCHRVQEFVHPLSNGQKLVFDDRTRAFKKLVDFRGTANDLASRVLDCLKLSKLRLEKAKNDYAVITNNDLSLNTSASKWMKEVVLTKRSDHIFRTVVVGDPNIKLGEIGIPCYIAEQLQISDSLTSFNWDQLVASCNLRFLEKGEVYIRRKGELVCVRSADKFQEGDVIRRSLTDGDIVLINRPPSIHQHSLLALYVKILPISSVVSINPLCCAPLRGDFDGDCLHGYISQSVDSRVELRELVAMDKQYLNGQSGKNLLSLGHDSLTAAHLVLSEGDLLGKIQVQQLQMLCPWPFEPPAILKSASKKACLWTGGQIFSMLLPPDFDYVSVPNGVHVNAGKLLSSPPGSSWMRGDDDGSFFESLTKHCRGGVLDCLHAAQQVLCEWISMRGFSVSLLDIYLSSDPRIHENMLEEVRCGLQEAEMLCNMKQLMVETSTNYLIENEEDSQDGICLDEQQLSAKKQKSAALSRAAVAAFKQVFRDVQNLMSDFGAPDNSLLAMIKSGSKGNMLKVAQQSLCIGMQHSLLPLTFRLPHKLSCTEWNYLKRPSSNANHGVPLECNKSYIPGAVVGSSYIMGLNPLECFVHSVTSRDSSFSENADVPGMLNRRLMFFMRDIYAAYDGTVRNAYGNQLVQFSYNAMGMPCQDPVDIVAGEPVGSLAGCAISEAAYSALDQPISILETSPLLNLKKVLESGLKRSNANKTFSLLLSKKLARERHGFEYAALEVKNQMEKLLFSDIVSTVMIESCCSSDADKRNRSTLCITATVIEKNSYTELDSIRDMVIPHLLGCVVKGFTEVEKVDILWNDRPHGSQSPVSSHGELCLRVSASSKCRKKKLWTLLMDNCLPIMDLIDWDRSVPDDLHDMFSSYGIGAAWRFFLGNLTSAVNDVGKTILSEHLILVTDCLSTTGEFVGLSAKGMTRQKSQMSVSAPFLQACFSNPGASFIKAAKICADDQLQGTLDALAWGKVPSLGTGAQFELVYSGKGHEIQKPVDVYSLLKSHTCLSEDSVKVKVPKTPELIPEKWSVPKLPMLLPSTNGFKNLKNLSKALIRSKISVQDIRKLSLAVKSILNKYEINERLSETDELKLSMALQFHPRRAEKIGAGFMSIKASMRINYVGNHPKHQDTRCFMLERTDGTLEDFSYHKCLHGALEIIAPGRAKNYESRWLKAS